MAQQRQRHNSQAIANEISGYLLPVAYDHAGNCGFGDVVKPRHLSAGFVTKFHENVEK